MLVATFLLNRGLNHNYDVPETIYFLLLSCRVGFTLVKVLHSPGIHALSLSASQCVTVDRSRPSEHVFIAGNIGENSTDCLREILDDFQPQHRNETFRSMAIPLMLFITYQVKVSSGKVINFRIPLRQQYRFRNNMTGSTVLPMKMAL